jgi:hypothetical protein
MESQAESAVTGGILAKYGEVLFVEQTPLAKAGLLNRSKYLRYGWGRVTYGLVPSEVEHGAPAAMYVLRFASGGRRMGWWVHWPYPF